MSAAAAAGLDVRTEVIETPKQRKDSQLTYWKLILNTVTARGKLTDFDLADVFKTSDNPSAFDIRLRNLCIADPFYTCVLLELVSMVFKDMGISINPVGKPKRALTPDEVVLAVAICKFTEVYGVGVINRIESALEDTNKNETLYERLVYLRVSLPNLRSQWELPPMTLPVASEPASAAAAATDVQSAAVSAASIHPSDVFLGEEFLLDPAESKYGKPSTPAAVSAAGISPYLYPVPGATIKSATAADPERDNPVLHPSASSAACTDPKPAGSEGIEWSDRPTWDIIIPCSRADAAEVASIVQNARNVLLLRLVRVDVQSDIGEPEDGYVRISVTFPKRFVHLRADERNKKLTAACDVSEYEAEAREISDVYTRFLTQLLKSFADSGVEIAATTRLTDRLGYLPIVTDSKSSPPVFYYRATYPRPIDEIPAYEGLLFWGPKGVRDPVTDRKKAAFTGTYEDPTQYVLRSVYYKPGINPYFRTNPLTFHYDPFYAMNLKAPRRLTENEREAIRLAKSISLEPKTRAGDFKDTKHSAPSAQAVSSSAAAAAAAECAMDDSETIGPTWEITIPCVGPYDPITHSSVDYRTRLVVESVVKKFDVIVRTRTDYASEKFTGALDPRYVIMLVSFRGQFVRQRIEERNKRPLSECDAALYNAEKLRVDKVYIEFLNALRRELFQAGIKTGENLNVTRQRYRQISGEGNDVDFFYTSAVPTVVDEIPNEAGLIYREYNYKTRAIRITNDPTVAVYAGTDEYPCLYVNRMFLVGQSVDVYFRTNPLTFNYDPFYSMELDDPRTPTGSLRATGDGRHRPTAPAGYRIVTLRPDWSVHQKYQIMFWFPRPYHSNDTDAYSNYESSQAKECDLWIPTSIPRNVPLGIALCTWRVNYQNQLCQYGVGSATITIGELLRSQTHTVELRNVRGHTQGQLRVDVPGYQSHGITLEEDSKEWSRQIVFPRNLSQKWITGGFSERSVVAKSFRRTHISWWRGQEMPVWIFPLLKDCAAPFPNEYFERAIRNACRWFGFASSKEWTAKALVTDRGFEVLAQVCGYEDWHQPYLYDKESVGGKLELYDEFSSLRRKSDVKARAGDCEDFTNGMRWTHEALLKLPFGKSAELDTLADMAKGYCYFVVDTSISNKGSAGETDPIHDSLSDVALHMYGLLMPWAMIHAMLMKGGYEKLAAKLDPSEVKRTQHWPRLSLESTEMSIGNWLITHVEAQRFIRQLPKMGKAGKKIRAHTSSMIYKEDGFYRMAIGAYSSTLFDITGVHSWLFAAEDGKEWKFGVPNRDLMNYSDHSRICLRPVGRATESDYHLIKSVQDRMPAPYAVKVPEQEDELKYVQDRHMKTIMAFTRAFEWTDADQREFDAALVKHGYVQVVERQKLTRLSGADSYVFQLRRKK